MASSQDLLSFIWLGYFCLYFYMIYNKRLSLASLNDRIQLGLLSLAIGVMAFIFIKLVSQSPCSHNS